MTNVTDRQQRLRFEGSNTSSQKFGSYQIRKDKVQLYHSEGDRVHLDWVLEPRGKLQLELRLKFQPNWLNHVTIALLFLVAEDTGADQILDDNFKLIRAEPKTVLIKFI